MALRPCWRKMKRSARGSSCVETKKSDVVSVACGMATVEKSPRMANPACVAAIGLALLFVPAVDFGGWMGRFDGGEGFDDAVGVCSPFGHNPGIAGLEQDLLSFQVQL